MRDRQDSRICGIDETAGYVEYTGHQVMWDRQDSRNIGKTTGYEG